MKITIQGGGGATAVAARVLARENASVATICGAGRQGRIQLTSLAAVRRLSQALAWDLQPTLAQGFAREMEPKLGIPVIAVAQIREGTLQSDMIVTCTPSKAPFPMRGDVRAAKFISAA